MKTKKKYLLLFFAAIAFVLAGCPPYEPPIHNAYSVTIETLANGTITASPKSNIKEGDSVTLTVTPAEGYQLKPGSLGVHLENDLVITPTGSETTWTFEMPDSNVTVKGEFENLGTPPPTHLVTIASGITNGTITANSANAAAGTLVTLTVEPENETYFLRSGSLRVVPETGPTIIPTLINTEELITKHEFTMPASDVTVSGIFGSSIPTYRVNIASGITNGTITADLNSGLYGGEPITLTITPDEGYRLKSGSLSVQTSSTTITLEGSENTWTFEMPTSNVTVRGEFEEDIFYSVTLPDETPNGTITPSSDSDLDNLTGGETITLTITPVEGYKIRTGSLSVQTISGTEITLDNSEDTWIFEMPHSNVTVSCIFEDINKIYYVNIETITNGRIVASDTNVKEGDIVTLTIEPDEGYQLDLDSISILTEAGKVSINGSGNTWTFVMPNYDVTISNEFERIIITLGGIMYLRILNEFYPSSFTFIEVYSDPDYTDRICLGNISSYNNIDGRLEWNIELDYIYDDTPIYIRFGYKYGITRTYDYGGLYVSGSHLNYYLTSFITDMPHISLNGTVHIYNSDSSLLDGTYLYIYCDGEAIARYIVRDDALWGMRIPAFDTPTRVYFYFEYYNDDSTLLLYDTGEYIDVLDSNIEDIELGDFYPYP